MTYLEYLESLGTDRFRVGPKDVYEDAVRIERERIRDIIKAVGVQGNHNEWFDCVDTILERIDATTE